MGNPDALHEDVDQKLSLTLLNPRSPCVSVSFPVMVQLMQTGEIGLVEAVRVGLPEVGGQEREHRVLRKQLGGQHVNKSNLSGNLKNKVKLLAESRQFPHNKLGMLKNTRLPVPCPLNQKRTSLHQLIILQPTNYHQTQL